MDERGRNHCDKPYAESVKLLTQIMVYVVELAFCYRRARAENHNDAQRYQYQCEYEY
jgi:hypothetical protein